MKKIPETSSTNNNNSINSVNTNYTSANNYKQLDKISEETKKDNETDGVSSVKYEMRYSSARTRTSQRSIFELKPPTVEVFFRNTNKTDQTT